MKRYTHPELADVTLATAMQALSDPRRVEIVRQMMEAGRPVACNEIQPSVGKAKATMSHHFEILRAAGVIETRSAGTKCLSTVRVEALEERFPGLLRLVLSEFATVKD